MNSKEFRSKRLGSGAGFSRGTYWLQKSPESFRLSQGPAADLSPLQPTFTPSQDIRARRCDSEMQDHSGFAGEIWSLLKSQPVAK